MSAPALLRSSLVLWALALPPAAGAAEPAAPVVLTLSLNRVPQEATFPVLRGDDVLMPLEDLSRVHVEVQQLGGKREELEGKAYVSLRSLAPEVSYVLDELNAHLELTVPPRLLPATRVDLRTHASPAPEPAGEPSLALNYAAHMKDLRLALSAEAAAGVGSLLLSSGASWSAGQHPVRGLSQLTFDQPSHMLRTVLGDAQAIGGQLGGNALIGGVHFSRNFELNPGFIQSPSFQLQGSAATPASVDVYVNGTLVRHTDVPPGPFELANLPLTHGMMGTRYVLRDAFGREQELTRNQYVASGLLASGVSSFNFSLGLVREEVATENFRYGQAAFLGSYRRGLSPQLTGGLRLELARRLASGGSAVSLGLGWGELELAAAGSFSQGRGGGAGSATFAYLSNKLALQAALRGMSPAYATLGMPVERDRLLFNASASASVALTALLRVGGELSAGHFRDSGGSVGAAATGSVRLGDTTLLTLSAGANTKPSGVGYNLLASLSTELSPHTFATISSQQRSSGTGAQFSLSRSATDGLGVSYQARGELAQHPWGNATASYQGAYGRGSASLGWYQGKPTVEADATGSVVAVGGHVMVSRPVGQGFALVRVPGLEGARVFLNNHEVARTGSDGTALVPNLLPFYGNRLSISDQDIPDDFGVPDLVKLVAPYSRRGATVLFSSRRIRPLRGTVALAGVDTAVLAYGELTLKVGTELMRSPISARGEFELEGVPEGVHEASVAYAGGVCHVRLEVPATSQKLIELEQLPCVTRPGGEP